MTLYRKYNEAVAQGNGVQPVGTADGNNNTGVTAAQGTQGTDDANKINPTFATEVEGTEYSFTPVPKGQTKPFADYDEFYQETAEGGTIPQQGDMVASNDGFLYAFAGPTIDPQLSIGWYRSTTRFHGGPAAAAEGGNTQTQAQQ